jgi:hypothetical protein
VQDELTTGFGSQSITLREGASAILRRKTLVLSTLAVVIVGNDGPNMGRVAAVEPPATAGGLELDPDKRIPAPLRLVALQVGSSAEATGIRSGVELLL